ncbi:hypothetical protein NDU88_002206 [Pleurodeles waltl]|uniref:Uncharacterized protein n=1 Tax=Pleurodeles waltl TaxID=8319 RepID=A0AAV7U9A2_PLEWA|nr:hypothetical protein NDU88_002206 [Pleurodeles waltl]
MVAKRVTLLQASITKQNWLANNVTEEPTVDMLDAGWGLERVRTKDEIVTTMLFTCNVLCQSTVLASHPSRHEPCCELHKYYQLFVCKAWQLEPNDSTNRIQYCGNIKYE